jgi:CheY-like chemotaxis protein
MAPQEALRLFANECFDLVITDYKMPRLNGIEFIQQLRKQQPEVRIILLSGFTESLGLNEQNTGADAVMQKSANEVSHLVNAVNRLLRKVPKKSSRKPPGSESAPPKRARGQGV